MPLKILNFLPIDEKLKAFQWEVFHVNGHNCLQLSDVFQQARAIKDKPVFIIADTIKGKGVSFMENDPGWHGTRKISEMEYQTAMEDIARSEGL